jgi:hypothetical protein
MQHQICSPVFADAETLDQHAAATLVLLQRQTPAGTWQVFENIAHPSSHQPSEYWVSGLVFEMVRFHAQKA